VNLENYELVLDSLGLGPVADALTGVIDQSNHVVLSNAARVKASSREKVGTRLRRGNLSNIATEWTADPQRLRRKRLESRDWDERERARVRAKRKGSDSTRRPLRRGRISGREWARYRR
jgi:hypothetical protein